MQKKTLMVVYDKAYENSVTYLKGLVETNDDIKNGDDVKIVGVEDNTVEIGTMSDKQYGDNKVKIPSSQKILFIGDVHEKKNLENIMTVLYNKYGITIGYFGNQMLVTTDFMSMLSYSYYDFRMDFELMANAELPCLNEWPSLLEPYFGSVSPVGRLMRLINILEYRDNINLIKKQQRLFAILELYMNHLDKFMKA